MVLDPEREVMPLLGAKEGLAHLCMAQLDAGDAALVADPGYPVYRGGPALAGAEAIAMPLRRRAPASCPTSRRSEMPRRSARTC